MVHKADMKGRISEAARTIGEAEHIQGEINGVRGDNIRRLRN
jgi:hypothetical protein